MRPDAETLLTALRPDSPHALHVGDSVAVIAASAEIRNRSDESGILRTVEAGTILKVVEIKNERLLVSVDGAPGQGWIPGIAVVKCSQPSPMPHEKK